jgi:hypothetical protein
VLVLLCAVEQSQLLAEAAGGDSSQLHTHTRQLVHLSDPIDFSASECDRLPRRALLNNNGDNNVNPRAPPNPVLAATPLTQEAASVTGTSGTITVVTTPQELYAALTHGARHIDLRNHIDLTVLPIDRSVEWSEALLPEVKASTASITVCFLSSTC